MILLRLLHLGFVRNAATLLINKLFILTENAYVGFVTLKYGQEWAMKHILKRGGYVPFVDRA